MFQSKVSDEMSSMRSYRIITTLSASLQKDQMELTDFSTHVERIRLPQLDIHVIPSFSRAKQPVQTRYTFLHRDVQVLTIRIRVLAIRSSLVAE